MRFILASKSPSRLELLRRAGLDPEVMASDFDESTITKTRPLDLVLALAQAKGDSVAARLSDDDAIVVACDSVLEFDGRARGKPRSAEAAAELWRRMSGKQGVLHTGHFVLVRRDGWEQRAIRAASTVVRFADLTEEEVVAYAASGEPANVAGAFTIDGLGGAFITGIDGDPHNVVGLSLPLLRQILLDLGVQWPTLWRHRSMDLGRSATVGDANFRPCGSTPIRR
ncbi:MAG: nucleoside triphosphate pyrophosphatase [Propionibacteriaceae bacterium]|nr:nucleoside triphosphate pyrophosphatase [Propionibacteriaceae bacterium]